LLFLTSFAFHTTAKDPERIKAAGGQTMIKNYYDDGTIKTLTRLRFIGCGNKANVRCDNLKRERSEPVGTAGPSRSAFLSREILLPNSWTRLRFGWCPVSRRSHKEFANR
jgi:hypothetical protein